MPHLILIILLLLYLMPGFSLEDKLTIWEILTTDFRFKELISSIEKNNLTRTYKDLNSSTVFAATDSAFSLNLSVKHQVSREQLLYHVTTVSIKSDQLWDGRVLQTFAHTDNTRQKLKIQRTKTDISISTGVSKKVKISKPDIAASNGVIHVVNELLPLPQPLDQTLNQVEDAQEFYEACEKSDLLPDLKQAKSNTLFVAQGDVVGDELASHERNYLLEHPEGQNDLKRLLNHQIATDVFFSSDFKEGNSTVKTVDGTEELAIQVVKDKGKETSPKITVNNIPVIQSDIIASNGVIHILEKPLMPNNKQDFLKMTPRKALIGLNSTGFVELVDKHKLSNYLDEKQETTFLAPPNDEVGSVLGRKELETWVKYHIIQGRYFPHELKDKALLETKAHHDLGEHEFQRIDVHVSQNNDGKSIQFGRSSVLGNPASGKHFIMYPLQRSLELPLSSSNQIAANLNLSAFHSSLHASGSMKALKTAQGISVFAPTNDAFSQLGLVTDYLLLPDSKKDLQQVMLYHVVRGLFYNQTTEEGEYYHERTLQGDTIELNKTNDGFFVHGYGSDRRWVLGRVSLADTITSNGVLHTIDRVQIPPTLDIDNRKLVSVKGLEDLFSLMQHADISDQVLTGLDPKNPYTILAPSDLAFHRFGNLAGLLDDKERLTEIIKLHVIPGELPCLDCNGVPFTGQDYPTLLNSIVQIYYRSEEGVYRVGVKGSQESATVQDVGRNTAGGGVIMIDRVLVPEKKEDEPKTSFPWWTIILMSLGGIVLLINVFIFAYIGWKWYNGHNEGYIELPEEH